MIFQFANCTRCLFLDTVTDSQHLHGDDLPRLALAKQGDTFEDGRAGGGCYILGSFFDEHPSRNWLSGPSGPCQDCYESQHDHVYIFTPSTAARVRARDSMMFSSKACALERSGNPPHVPASNPAKACESRGVQTI